MQVDKLSHSELIRLGCRWLIKPYASVAPYGHGGCSVVVTEISTSTFGGEQPDVLGFSGKKSILIECKTSRSDFKADENKVFRHPSVADMALGSQRWYLAPEGVIPKDKVPVKWGLLEVTSEGKIKVIIKPELQDRNRDSEIKILISLLRRLNIQKDDHVAIRRYEDSPMVTVKGEPILSKKRAMFYIGVDIAGEHESVGVEQHICGNLN